MTRLQAHQVLVKTELASGKHGTTTAMFDNLNFRGQHFDIVRLEDGPEVFHLIENEPDKVIKYAVRF